MGELVLHWLTVPSGFSCSPGHIVTVVPAGAAARNHGQPAKLTPKSTTYTPGLGWVTARGRSRSVTVIGGAERADTVVPAGRGDATAVSQPDRSLPGRSQPVLARRASKSSPPNQPLNVVPPSAVRPDSSLFTTVRVPSASVSSSWAIIRSGPSLRVSLVYRPGVAGTWYIP